MAKLNTLGGKLMPLTSVAMFQLGMDVGKAISGTAEEKAKAVNQVSKMVFNDDERVNQSIRDVLHNVVCYTKTGIVVSAVTMGVIVGHFIQKTQQFAKKIWVAFQYLLDSVKNFVDQYILMKFTHCATPSQLEATA